MLLALEGVPSIAGMSRKQLLFVLQVINMGSLGTRALKNTCSGGSRLELTAHTLEFNN